MSFMDLARKRYSSREYKDAPVEQEKIDAILEAGRISPTAVNAQPVRVIAVRTPEGLSKVSEGANIYGAPLAFIVYADRSKAWVRKYDGMNSAEIDASIVTTQMMYEATDLGLGSVWTCYFDPEVINRNFGLRGDLVPVNILAVGYSADTTSRNQGNRIPDSTFFRYE